MGPTNMLHDQVSCIEWIARTCETARSTACTEACGQRNRFFMPPQLLVVHHAVFCCCFFFGIMRNGLSSVIRWCGVCHEGFVVLAALAGCHSGHVLHYSSICSSDERQQPPQSSSPKQNPDSGLDEHLVVATLLERRRFSPPRESPSIFFRPPSRSPHLLSPKKIDVLLACCSAAFPRPRTS